MGAIAKIEIHPNKVGTFERTKAVIEPRLSDQWFLKMDDLVKPAIKSVLESDEIKLYPKRFENTYRHWLENIRDWNISRQLWWGQQILAYYYGDGKEDFVVAETKEAALELAKAKNASITAETLRQHPTPSIHGFSSWLWPMAVFGGIMEPENKDFKYYYPTNDLVYRAGHLVFLGSAHDHRGLRIRWRETVHECVSHRLVRDKQS